MNPDGLPSLGATLAGKYRLTRELGRGGMGVVYEATHLRLEQRVAIKIVLPQVASRPELAHRFAQEARATARLKGRHTVRVLDVDATPEGLPFLVMEFLEGRTLRDELLQRGPLPVADAVRYVREACEGVEEAHRAGIIHRDLKPANLFLSLENSGPIVKVVDFGVAKAVGPDDGHLTATNVHLGTYKFMSPEQIRSARSVDHRTDIWALGVVLYQLLTGKTPFSGPGAVGVALAITTQPPPPLRVRRPDVPEALVAIVERALSKEPAGRHASARELSDELAPFGGFSTLTLRERSRPALSSHPSSTDMATVALAPSPSQPAAPAMAPYPSPPAMPSAPPAAGFVSDLPPNFASELASELGSDVASEFGSSVAPVAPNAPTLSAAEVWSRTPLMPPTAPTTPATSTPHPQPPALPSVTASRVPRPHSNAASVTASKVPYSPPNAVTASRVPRPQPNAVSVTASKVPRAQPPALPSTPRRTSSPGHAMAPPPNVPDIPGMDTIAMEPLPSSLGLDPLPAAAALPHPSSLGMPPVPAAPYPSVSNLPALLPPVAAVPTPAFTPSLLASSFGRQGQSRAGSQPGPGAPADPSRVLHETLPLGPENASLQAAMRRRLASNSEMPSDSVTHGGKAQIVSINPDAPPTGLPISPRWLLGGVVSLALGAGIAMGINAARTRPAASPSPSLASSEQAPTTQTVQATLPSASAPLPARSAPSAHLIEQAAPSASAPHAPSAHPLRSRRASPLGARHSAFRQTRRGARRRVVVPRANADVEKVSEARSGEQRQCAPSHYLVICISLIRLGSTLVFFL